MLNIKKLLSKLVQQQENMIKVVHNVSLNSSGSIAAGRACAIVQTFVTNSIPDGYKLLAVVLRGTTNATFFCWYLDWTSTTNRVDYRVTNNGSSAAAVSPTVNLICVKIGGGYCVVFAMLSALLRGGAGHAKYKEALRENYKPTAQHGQRISILRNWTSKRKFLQRCVGHVQQNIQLVALCCSQFGLIIDRSDNGEIKRFGNQYNKDRIYVENIQLRFKWTFSIRQLDSYGSVIPERGCWSC